MAKKVVRTKLAQIDPNHSYSIPVDVVCEICWGFWSGKTIKKIYEDQCTTCLGTWRSIVPFTEVETDGR